MKQVIRWIDGAIDGILALFFLLLLLLGSYFFLDTAYLYRHTATDFAPPQMTTQERAYTKDYVAWLCLDDTPIDYPVMQGDTNTAYLNTDPYGEYSLAGSIFLDYRNANDFSDDYTLIYGHHIEDGLMFGALDQYYDEGFFDTHTVGRLTVGHTVYPLTVFSVLTVDASESCIFEPGECSPVLELAQETAEQYREPEAGRILALTTCTQAGSTKRTVVLATIGEGEEEKS